jgi:hypothetical protein
LLLPLNPGVVNSTSEKTGEAAMQLGGTSGKLLGVGAVREFNVLRDSYGAECGKRPGAQVLIAT